MSRSSLSQGQVAGVTCLWRSVHGWLALPPAHLCAAPCAGPGIGAGPGCAHLAHQKQTAESCRHPWSAIADDVKKSCCLSALMAEGCRQDNGTAGPLARGCLRSIAAYPCCHHSLVDICMQCWAGLCSSGAGVLFLSPPPLRLWSLILAGVGSIWSLISANAER